MGIPGSLKNGASTCTTKYLPSSLADNVNLTGSCDLISSPFHVFLIRYSWEGCLHYFKSYSMARLFSIVLNMDFWHVDFAKRNFRFTGIIETQNSIIFEKRHCSKSRREATKFLTSLFTWRPSRASKKVILHLNKLIKSLSKIVHRTFQILEMSYTIEMPWLASILPRDVFVWPRIKTRVSPYTSNFPTNFFQKCLFCTKQIGNKKFLRIFGTLDTEDAIGTLLPCNFVFLLNIIKSSIFSYLSGK